MLEVQRPNRQHRRRYGKSDPADAIGAARAVQAGEASGIPKAATGSVESIRLLQVARRSAIKARTQAANQLHAIVTTAPDQLRATLAGLTTSDLVERAARLRPGTIDHPTAAAKLALTALARRSQALTAEINELDRHLDELTTTAAPTLVALNGVGTQTASTLLTAAGDNPDRLLPRVFVRCPLRQLPARRVIRAPTTTSPQPRRRPTSQRCALHHRDQPSPMGTSHQELHATTPGRGQDSQRNHPLPQALRRPPSPPSDTHRPRDPTHRQQPTRQGRLTSIEASATR